MKRMKRRKKHHSADEQSDVDANVKNNKRNKKETDSESEDKGKRNKKHGKERNVKEIDSEDESDDRNEWKQMKKEKTHRDELSKSESKRKNKKHKKEKNDRSSDIEEGRYQSRDDDRRKRRKDKRREREDHSHDSDLEYISRPVGSRYYDVQKHYDEDQITYKESQVKVGSRYYGDSGRKDQRDSTKQTPQNKQKTENESKPESSEPKTSTNILSSKTGGAYIPPAKLKLMQQSISDKSSVEYQRISWETLKKSIHGSVNKVNTGNIGIIARKLFQENIIRGRGLLTRTILQAQAASPTFTNVYAALVDIINSKFPSIGELLLNRCIQQFKRSFKRNDKALCINSVTFIAHLVNQQVAHEIIVLEILTLLVETPTNDSIEVACALLKECGKKLTELSSKGVTAIFSMLLNILHEGKLEKRVQYMIEVLAQVRKDNFKDFPDVIEDLDLVPEEDKFTHLMTLDGVKDTQDILNVFQYDPEYLMNEEKYTTLRREILGDEDEDDEDGDDEEDEDEEESEAEEGEKENKETIIDNTETNLVALRRTIYLTIHSSLDFEECAHKLLRMQLKPGQESELCHMFLDCCAEQRTYEKFFGLLAQRFCQINKMYVAPLEQIFRESYSTVHRLDINKLRNVAKFFAHQLFTDAIGWHVLSCIHLNEEETTSSGRIFIKILFQELSEYMGLSKLNQKIKDP
ncbi:pre-mRNA-splicing factor CWC22 homolog isoform X1 [Diaphorina citri]|nr:pre-mRNA-splicing factor CWC22 homolog isoform X1 [Diaphorina citri]